MYHSFWIHSFADGHLGCFQHLAIVNCAAVNTGVHRFFWIGVSGFLGYSPSSGIAGSKGSSQSTKQTDEQNITKDTEIENSLTVTGGRGEGISGEKRKGLQEQL